MKLGIADVPQSPKQLPHFQLALGKYLLEAEGARNPVPDECIKKYSEWRQQNDSVVRQLKRHAGWVLNTYGRRQSVARDEPSHDGTYGFGKFRKFNCLSYPLDLLFIAKKAGLIPAQKYLEFIADCL